MGVTRALLDTHTLLWALAEPKRLGHRARSVITDVETEIVVSAVSAWEIATKHRLGKLPNASSLIFGYREHLARLRAQELPVTSWHALTAGGLSWGHRDPFDRMLAAQSVLESLPLLSADTEFDDCVGVRRLW